MSIATNLVAIRVLYRAPDTLSLYGIPYDMRPGQQPRDLVRAQDQYHAAKPRLYGPGDYGPAPVSLDWMWLGSPGWFGSYTAAEIEEVKAFLAAHAQDIPQGPGEWSALPAPKGQP